MARPMTQIKRPRFRLFVNFVKSASALRAEINASVTFENYWMVVAPASCHDTMLCL